jgi:hypothetical protein
MRQKERQARAEYLNMAPRDRDATSLCCGRLVLSTDRAGHAEVLTFDSLNDFCRRFYALTQRGIGEQAAKAALAESSHAVTWGQHRTALFAAIRSVPFAGRIIFDSLRPGRYENVQPRALKESSAASVLGIAQFCHFIHFHVSPICVSKLERIGFQPSSA